MPRGVSELEGTSVLTEDSWGMNENSETEVASEKAEGRGASDWTSETLHASANLRESEGELESGGISECLRKRVTVFTRRSELDQG